MKKIVNLNKIKVGKRVFYIANEKEKDKLNDIKLQFQKKYQIKMPNRDTIIKELISHLTHGDYNNFTIPDIGLMVLRTDIKNFYPSINKHRLYKKINSSNVLSNDAIQVIKNICFNKNIEGVPLGLSFSNHLAELYVENLDNEILVEFNPISYFRYIDDILILKYDFSRDLRDRQLEKEKNIDLITFYANKYKLEINNGKTSCSFYKFNKSQMNKNVNLKFIYLGYEFETVNKKLIIRISSEKLEKYKKRISSYIYIYRKGKKREIDFWRLYYKILNVLHGVTILDRNNKKMKLGIGYHYRFINDYSVFNEFEYYCRKLIYSLKLKSNKQTRLLNLIRDSNNTTFMEKRYNYLNLSKNQMNIIAKRLSIRNPSKDNEKFSKKLFVEIYK